MPIHYYNTGPSLHLGGTQESVPDSAAKRGVLQHIEQDLHEEQRLYAVVLNSKSTQEMCADLIVIAEHGMGFMNLCQESGSISREGDIWAVDGNPITIDKRLGYRNPHEKIQHCAVQIRERLMNPTQATKSWLQGRYLTWQDLFFDTAVCFTHPDADIDYFRKYYAQELREGKHTKAWERFTILKPEEISNWVTTICFEEDVEERFSVQSYRLSSTYILRVATEFFQTTELAELPEPQVTGQTYGYLIMKEYGEVAARFHLDQEQMTLGRDPSCDILLPRGLTMVSRVHATLTCSAHGVLIQDSSLNGTFVNGVRVQAPRPLASGQEILLGGDKVAKGVCCLEFSTTAPDAFVDWD